MKTTREHLNIIGAFHELGSDRTAARLCGTTHKTVKKIVERHQAGGPWARRPRLTSRNTDPVVSVWGAKSPSSVFVKRLYVPRPASAP